MNWSGLKGIVGKAAPMLGTLLGGPAGASIGTLIAGVLGVEPSPGAVEKALAVNPDAAVKLAEIESRERVSLETLVVRQCEAELTAETQRLQAVNATMQAESKSEHWMQYAWRPFWGFVSASAFLAVCIFVCILGYRAITKADASSINMIPQLIGAFTALFAVPGAILGVSAWHRGKQKREQLTGGQSASTNAEVR